MGIVPELSNSTNITQQELDRQAIARADELVDAEMGWAHYHQLEAKWRDEGRQLFLDGQSRLACWNHCQWESYDEAAAAYAAVVEEADLKPELGEVDYEPLSVQYAWEVA